MGNEKNSSSPPENFNGKLSEPIYEIRVKAVMDEKYWADCFEGMTFHSDGENGETRLRGPVADQAALYGLLSRLRNYGLNLISVQQIDPKS